MKKVKDYLNQVKYIDYDIQTRHIELDNLRRSMRSSSNYSVDSVQESRSLNDGPYEKLVTLLDSIDDKIDSLVETKKAISKEIDKLPDKLSACVLRDRYINGRDWTDIAKGLDQSERNVHRMHGQALQEFYKQNQSFFDNRD